MIPCGHSRADCSNCRGRVEEYSEIRLCICSHHTEFSLEDQLAVIRYRLDEFDDVQREQYQDVQNDRRCQLEREAAVAKEIFKLGGGPKHARRPSSGQLYGDKD
jgi:hypothetical protein